jgi:uroporphyrinogen decarboxylase
VGEHVAEAINEVDGKGLIIGPGCGADQLSSETNIFAVRKGVFDSALVKLR